MLHVLLFFFTYISGFLFTFISNPVFSFVLYEAVYFFYPASRWWGYIVPDISYSFLTVILMLAAYLLGYKSHNLNKIFAAPQLKWAYLILFLYFVAYFYSVYPEDHKDALINFGKLIIIISIAYKIIDTSKKLDYVLWGYIFGSWYISFLTFQSGRNIGNRVEGIGTVDSPDSNGIAAAIAPSLVLCLYYFWKSDKKLFKIIFALSGIFIANALILINSRGAFLASAVSIIFYMCYMYFSHYQKPYQKAMAVWITVAGLSGAAYLADDTFIERMKSIQNTEIDETLESGSTRIIFWKSAWEMAKEHPFGAGFRGFNYYAPAYTPEGVHTGNSLNRSVHSAWFETLSETGYLGLTSLIMMLYASFRTTKKCKLYLSNKNDINNYFKIIALESALIAFIVAMTFLNRMRAELLYWCILYTACAYNIYVLKDSKLLENKE